MYMLPAMRLFHHKIKLNSDKVVQDNQNGVIAGIPLPVDKLILAQKLRRGCARFSDKTSFIIVWNKLFEDSNSIWLPIYEHWTGQMSSAQTTDGTIHGCGWADLPISLNREKLL